MTQVNQYNGFFEKQTNNNNNNNNSLNRCMRTRLHKNKTTNVIFETLQKSTISFSTQSFLTHNTKKKKQNLHQKYQVSKGQFYEFPRFEKSTKRALYLNLYCLLLLAMFFGDETKPT